MKKGKKNFVFTVTTGRSGTLYLKELLEVNLSEIESHHEILWGFDKFGKETPDVSHFHEFNSGGNTTKIMKFWMQKFSRIAKTKSNYYVETSHLLAKAGLVENLGLLKNFGQVYLVLLKRDVLKTLISMHKRNTYLNVGNMWLWHLDPSYSKNIVNVEPYKRFELQGLRLWYIHEMRARAEYYKQLLENDKGITIVDVDIDELNDNKGVEKFLGRLGYKAKKDKIEVLAPKHVGPKTALDPGLEEHFKKMIKSFIFSAEKLAKGYIEAGRRLG